MFLPGAGWIGFDPTSGLLAGKDIFRWRVRRMLRGGADWGTVEPSGVTSSYEMSVRRVNEAPRVPKPYSDEEWGGCEAVAHAVDADLWRRMFG